jgi:2',3'-cyclic-nucleotide 2'-phosphodiesterase (5'-nucleotidase family)
LDAGNSLIGDRGTAVNTKGQSSIEAMNMMGYDAMALGEGDLAALGLSILQQRIQEANFPVLSANAVLAATTERLVEPYLIREMGGHRVAIIGLTGPLTTTEVIILDPLETTKQMVAELKGHADVILLLSHAGLSTNHRIINAVPEIAFVISGGGKGVTPSPLLTADGRMTLHPDSPTAGHAGRYIGAGRWTFGISGQLTDYDWRQLALDPTITDDPQLASWAQNHP